MKKTGSFLKKVLSIVLVIVMVAGMTTLSPIGKVTASAANNVTAGGFTLTSALTLSASDYSYDSTTNILTITSGKSVSISTTAATSDKIVVDSSAGAAITLNGAYIATSDGAALEIKSGTGDVTITLAGSNILQSNWTADDTVTGYAGLQKDTETGKLTIQSDSTGTGSLTAIGCGDGAGIGAGNNQASVENISINSGVIYAACSDVTIKDSNGKITAELPATGTGIGGSNNASKLTISGGTVYAKGLTYAIGGNVGGSSSGISIEGASVFTGHLNDSDTILFTDLIGAQPVNKDDTPVYLVSLEIPGITSNVKLTSLKYKLNGGTQDIEYVTEGNEPQTQVPTLANDTSKLYKLGVYLPDGATVVSAQFSDDNTRIYYPEPGTTITAASDNAGTGTLRFTNSVIYNLNGGTADDLPSWYDPSSETTIDTQPTRDGCDFKGWTETKTDGTVSAATTKIVIPKDSTGTKTYNATWQKTQPDPIDENTAVSNITADSFTITAGTDFQYYVFYSANGGYATTNQLSSAKWTDADNGVYTYTKNSTDTNNEYIVYYRVKADTSSDKPALASSYQTMEVYTLKPGESPTITVSDRQSGSITVDTKAGVDYFLTATYVGENSYSSLWDGSIKDGTLYKSTADGEYTFTNLKPETKYYIYAKRNAVADTSLDSAVATVSAYTLIKPEDHYILDYVNEKITPAADSNGVGYEISTDKNFAAGTILTAGTAADVTPGTTYYIRRKISTSSTPVTAETQSATQTSFTIPERPDPAAPELRAVTASTITIKNTKENQEYSIDNWTTVLSGNGADLVFASLGTGSYTISTRVKATAANFKSSSPEKDKSLTVSTADAPDLSGVTVSMAGYVYGDSPSVPGLNGSVPSSYTVVYYYSLTDKNYGGLLWNAADDLKLAAGTYYMYAVLTSESNDEYTTPAAAFQVSKRKLTVTAAINTKEYDGTRAGTGTITLSNAAYEENPTATGTFSWADKDAGTRSFNCKNIALASDNTVNVNYELSSAEILNLYSRSSSITKRGLTLPATEVTYNHTQGRNNYAQDQYFISGYSTGILNEKICITYKPYQSSQKRVGDYTFSDSNNDTDGTYKVSLSDINYNYEVFKNYAVKADSGKLTVKKLAVTIDTQNVRYWDGYEFYDTSYTNMYYTDWSSSALREELRKRQVSARDSNGTAYAVRCLFSSSDVGDYSYQTPVLSGTNGYLVQDEDYNNNFAFESTGQGTVTVTPETIPLIWQMDHEGVNDQTYNSHETDYDTESHNVYLTILYLDHNNVNTKNVLDVTYSGNDAENKGADQINAGYYTRKAVVKIKEGISKNYQFYTYSPYNYYMRVLLESGSTATDSCYWRINKAELKCNFSINTKQYDGTTNATAEDITFGTAYGTVTDDGLFERDAYSVAATASYAWTDAQAGTKDYLVSDLKLVAKDSTNGDTSKTYYPDAYKNYVLKSEDIDSVQTDAVGITKKELTLPAVDKNVTYNGGTAFTESLDTGVPVSETENEKLMLTYTSSSPDMGTYSPADDQSGSLTDGRYKVSLSDDTGLADNYTLKAPTKNLIINACKISIPENYHVLYNGTLKHDVTAVTENGDRITVTCDFPTVNADKEKAYTYSETAAAGTYQLEGRDNYTVDTENMGTITIDPLPVKLKWTCANADTAKTVTLPITYDGTEYIMTASVSNLQSHVTDDTASATVKDDVQVGVYSGVRTAIDAGNYNVSAASLTGTDKGNYTLETISGAAGLTANWTIAKAALTPYISGVSSKEYDGTTKVTGGTLGLKGLAVKDTGVTASGTFAWTAADAGTNTLNVTGIAVSGKTKEVTMPDGTKAAELDWANNYTFDSTVNGALSDDPQSELQTTASINKKSLKVPDFSQSYTGATAFPYTKDFKTGVKAGSSGLEEVIGLTYTASAADVNSYSYTADAATGTKPFYTISLSDKAGNAASGTTGGKATNYTISETGNGTFTITPATVTVSNSEVIYNGTNTFTITAKASDGTDVTLTANTYSKADAVSEAAASRDAGDYAFVTAAPAAGKYSILTLAAGNYSIAPITDGTKLTVKPAPAAISWYYMKDGAETLIPSGTTSLYTYTGTVQGITAKVTGFAGSEAALNPADTFTMAYDNNSKLNAGSYTASVTGLGNSNYTLTGATGRTQDWSIGKVTLTPTLKSVDAKQYDGTTRTTGGVINLATPVNSEQPAVTADITWTSADHGTTTLKVENIALVKNNMVDWTINYDLNATALDPDGVTPADGTTGIAPKAMDFGNGGNLSRTYNGTTAYTYTDPVSGTVFTITPSGKDADVYTCGAPSGNSFSFTTSDDNYTIADGSTLTITKYALTVPAGNFVYDGSKTYPVEVNGVTYQDDTGTDVTEKVTITCVPDSRDAGTYTFASVTGAGKYIVGLSDSKNYEVTDGAKQTIKARTAVLTWDYSTPFIYDGRNHTVTATVTNRVPEDTISLTYSDNTKSAAGSYKAAVTALVDGNNKALTNYVLPTEAVMKTLDWVIEPEKVDKPAADGNVFTYNGSNQTYSLTQDSRYTITGNVRKDAGEYDVTVKLNNASGNGYIWADGSTDDLTYTFVIAPRQVTPFVKSVTGREYNGGTDAVGTIGLDGVAESDSPAVGGTFAWTDSAAGTTTVNVTGIAFTGTEKNYTLANDSLEGITAPEGAMISKKALNNINSVTKIYDGSAVLTKENYQTGVGTETVTLTYTAASPLTGTYNYAADQTPAAGKFALALSGEGSGNYTVGTGTGDMVITSGELTLGDQTFTYNGGTTFTATVQGADQEDITVTFKTDAKDAGTYTYSAESGSGTSYTASLSAEDAKKYSILTSGTLTIAPLTAAFNWNYSGPLAYTGSVQTVTAEVSNMAAGDEAKDFALQYSGNTGTDASGYMAEVTGLGNSNYQLPAASEAQLAWAIGAMKVTKPAADTAAYTYSGDLQTYKLAENAAYTVSGNKQTEAGTYPVTVTLNNTGTQKNYVWADGSTEPAEYSFTIAKKALTPSVASVDSKTYDGTDSATGKIALSGAVKEDKPAAEGTFSWAGFSAGTFRAYVTDITLDEDSAKNYTLTASSLGVQNTPNGATITKKAVALPDAGKTYDGSASYTLASFNTGIENIIVSYNAYAADAGIYSYADAPAAGRYTVVLGDSRDYSVDADSSGTFTIHPKEITVPDKTVTYNGKKAFEQEITGVGGGKITAVYEATGKAAGSYAYSEAGEEGTYKVTFADGNYTAAAAGSGKLTITPAEVTGFTWDYTEPFTYDGTAKTVNAAVSNLVPGDTMAEFSLTYASVTEEHKSNFGTDAGSYTAIVTGLGNDNYVLKESVAQSGALGWEIKTNKVDKPAADATQFIYNGSTQTYSVAENPRYTVTGNTRKDAGSQTVTVALADKANTVWADTGDARDVTFTFTIAKKTLTPSIGSVDPKAYDGTTAGSGTITLDGAAGNEEPTATGTFTWNSADAGSDKVSVSNIRLDDSWTPNYELASTEISEQTAPEGTTVTKKTLDIAPVTKAYDGSAAYTIPNYSTGAGSETVKLVYTASSGEVGIYQYSDTAADGKFTLTIEGSTNYTIASAGDLTVTVNALKLPAAEFTYNGKNTFTQTVKGANGEDVTADYTLASKDAGVYNSIAASGESTYSVTLSDSTHYSVASDSGAITVSPLEASLIWNYSGPFTYDGTEKTVTAAVSNMADGDTDADFTPAYTGNKATDAGSYTAKVTGLGNSNYTLPEEGTSLDYVINKAPVTFSVTGNSAKYDGNVHKAEVTAAGLEEGKDFTVLYRSTSGAVVLNPTDAGTYDISAAILNTNYRHADSTTGAAETVGKLTITGIVDSAELVNGDIYTFHSLLDDSMVMDISNAAINAGANLQIYESNKSNAQKFIAKKTADGYWEFVPYCSGKMLEVVGGTPSKWVNAAQNVETDSDAQKWTVRTNGDGTITFISKADTQYVLDVANAGTANYTNVQCYNDNGTAAQKFRAEKVGTVPYLAGQYTIKSSVGTDMYLNVEGGSADNFTNIDIRTKDGSASQSFRLAYAPNGMYRILTFCGSAVDVYNANKARGTNVNQYGTNYSAAQNWYIEGNTDGTVSFKSECNGLYMDVKGGQADEGNNVQVWGGNGSAAQKWTLM